MPDMTIPARDADLLGWARALANNVEKSPSAYGLSVSDVQTIRQAVEEYEARLRIAKHPQTRTAPAVNSKDTVRNSLRDLLRVYVRLIHANRGVSDADKIALGIHIPKIDPTPRRCPQTSPLLGFIAATPGQHTLHYACSLLPNSRAKPFGALELELWCAFVDPDSEEPIPSSPPADAKYLGAFTRNPMVVEHPVPPRPMLIVYWGRWAGARGEVGPWSLGLPAGIIGKCRPVELTEQIEQKKRREQASARADDGDDTLKLVA